MRRLLERTRGMVPVRLLVVLGALLVLALSASAVEAAQEDGTPPRPDKRDYSSSVFAEQLAEQKAEERRLEQERQTPEARAERERSRTAYGDASDQQALAVAKGKFPDVVANPLWRPLELAQGERIAEFLGDHAALIDRGAGPDALLESTLPLRARDASGKMNLLDPALEDRGDHLAVANPLVDVLLPKRLEEGLSLPRQGIAFAPAGTQGQAAPRIVGAKAFYPNVSRDTDFFAAPLPAGVETFLQLRSSASSEEHVVNLDLPDGARIELPSGSAGDAQIVRGDHRIATVTAPVAWDADGRRVPVTYAVQGDTLTLRIPHRDGDYMYPLLVDPQWIVGGFGENYSWSEAQSPGPYPSDKDGWFFYENVDKFTNPFFYGLRIRNKADLFFNDGDFGEWLLQAPRQAYIESVAFQLVSHDPNGASTCTVFGIYDPTAGIFQSGTALDQDTLQEYPSPQTRCGSFQSSNRLHYVGSKYTADGPGGDPEGAPGNMAVFALRMNGSGTRTTRALTAMGEVDVTYWDDDDPELTSAARQSTGWVDDTQADGAPKIYSHPVSMHDPGLGAKKFYLMLGREPMTKFMDSTTDVYEIVRVDHPCTGDRRYRCPVDWSSTVDYQLREGRNVMSLFAHDLITRYGAPQHWTQLIDRSDPTVALSGSLKDNDGKTVRDPSYDLQIDASDGSRDVAANERSGVKSIEVLVDGTRDFYEEQSCPEGSCPMSRSYKFFSDDHGDGQHTVEVIVTDQLGHESRRTINVTVDRESAGAGELRHFTFEDQQLTDRSLLRVNVANGNALYTAEEISIAGTLLDLTVTRDWNSLTGRKGAFGNGWTISTGPDVKVDELGDGDVRFFGPSGYAVVFHKQSDGSFKSPRGIDADLQKRSDGGFDLELLESEETYRFGPDGRLQSHSEKNDHKLAYAYDSAGKLEKITDTQDRALTFSYNTQGLVSEINDATGRSWRYEYDDRGNLLRYFDPESSDRAQTIYAYDPADRLTDVYDQRGADPQDDSYARTHVDYAGDSRRVAAVIRDHDPNDQNNPEKNFRYGYDYSQQAEVCSKANNDGERRDTSVSTDPRGNATTYCSDEQEQVRKAKDALGHVTKKDYTPQGNVQNYTSQNGEITSFDFDSTGRLKSASRPGSEASTFEYHGSTFRVSQSNDPQGNDQFYQYDGPGNLTSITDENPTNPDGSPNDAANKLIELDYFTESETSSRPKVRGQLEFSKDGEDNKTTYDYYDNGNLQRENPPGAEQGSTEYAYDGLSRLTRVTDGRGKIREIAYDALDRPIRITYLNDPNNDCDDTYTRYAYDGAGNRLERADGTEKKELLTCTSSEQVDRYSYEERNLRVKDELRSGKVNEYSYDRAANLATLKDQSGTTTYSYNAVNLVSEIQEPDRSDGSKRTPMAFEYQPDQQLRKLTLPNGVVQENSYTNDRLTRIKATHPSQADPLTNLEYSYDDPNDASAKMVDLRHKVTDHARNITTEYDYDSLNRLTLANNTGSASERWTYSYNGSTNLVKTERESGDPTHYVYNQASELRCTYGGAKRDVDECADPATDYSFDDNGNMLSAEGGNSYAYNSRNQTTSVTPAGGSGIAMGYADTDQDERLRRGPTSFTENLLGLGYQTTTTKTLLGTTTETTYFARGERGEALGMRTQKGDFYYLTDSLGTVVALTDSQGKLAGRYRYDPYGQVIENTEQVQNPIRFTGQYYDAQTELYKMGVRYYDPATARWTQKDPLNLFQDPRQGNRYVYAGADPVNMVDPSGADIGQCLENLNPFGGDDGLFGSSEGCLYDPVGRLLEEFCGEGAPAPIPPCAPDIDLPPPSLPPWVPHDHD